MTMRHCHHRLLFKKEGKKRKNNFCNKSSRSVLLDVLLLWFSLCVSATFSAQTSTIYCNLAARLRFCDFVTTKSTFIFRFIVQQEQHANPKTPDVLDYNPRMTIAIFPTARSRDSFSPGRDGQITAYSITSFISKSSLSWHLVEKKSLITVAAITAPLPKVYFYRFHHFDLKYSACVFHFVWGLLTDHQISKFFCRPQTLDALSAKR